MAHTISFISDLFDPSAEPENPMNPIAGHGVLVWLREHALDGSYESTEPDCEDWGWYIGVESAGSSYMVGATGFDNEDDNEDDAEDDSLSVPLEWTIQVVKHRSLGDALRRKNRMVQDDPITRDIAEALLSNNGFDQVTVEYGR